MQLKKFLKKCVVVMTATAMMATSVQFNAKVNAAETNQPLGANVALGKTMIIPEGAYTNPGNETDTENRKKNIPRILDGNVKQGFQAVNTTSKEDPQVWVIDLEESYTIDKIKLYWENGARATEYNIYTSNENSESEEDWTLVGEITNGEANITCKFTAVEARYVKLDLKVKTATWGYNLYEAEVYTVGSTEAAVTENLALTATATASSWDGNNTADKAIDGNTDSIWQGPNNKKDENGVDVKDDEGKSIPLTNEEKGREYITLQWEEEQTFNVISAVWGNGYLKGYKFQTSTDGEEWTDIYEVADGTGGETRRIVLEQPVTTKYFRLQGVTLGAYRAELKELQIYDETNIPVEKIYINKNKIKFNMDDENALSEQLEVSVNPSNATDQSVTWESSNPAVATVDENGLITAVKAGIATITVSSVSNPEVTAECQIAVASSLDKAEVTASKVEGQKAINVTWNTIEGAASYELYRVNSNGEETKVYDGTEVTYTDEALESGTYSYYVKEIAPDDSDIYADSTSEVTEGVVIPVDVTGVEISNNEISIYVGDSRQLTAVVAPDNATYKDVTWSSDDENIAIVDEEGNVTAVKEGKAVITVTTVDGNFTATCTVNAIPVDAESIVLDKDSETVELGSTVQLEATVNPSNTTYKDITWTTMDDAIASVDENGVVTAKGVGTTVITATAVSGVTAECTITVKITPAKVALNKTEVELLEGKTTTLSATVTPDNATDKTVKWTSDNTAVATVDENGNITAVKAGTATITVTTNDGNVSATCKVTVKKEVAVTTGNEPTTTTKAGAVNAPSRAKIVKVTAKKKSAKKVKLTLKKITGAKGYQIQILTSKKAKKALVKKTVKKTRITVKSKKLKNKKKLFVKVRAYVLDAKGTKVYGKWSTAKKIKIKK